MYLSENLIKTQAEMMVKKGYLSVGYEYVIVDDCWLDHKRDDGGQLQPDPERFPSGIKNLADYVCNTYCKLCCNFFLGTYPSPPGVCKVETSAQTLLPRYSIIG